MLVMTEEIIGLLRFLKGIVAAELLSSTDMRKIMKIEGVYEQSTFLPLKNLGMEITAKRERVIVLLKDPSFRKPPAPTVYMVEEEGENPVDGHVLHIEQKHYRIIGEEILDSKQQYAEKILSLGDSFVLYPERRGSKITPAFFLVPPLPFPELVERREYFKIKDIVSVSPSCLVDGYLRESFGFTKETTFATLLIGYNPE
jgi:hypothetical protein